MKINEFCKALRENDFAVGDSFCIGDFEFEVVNRRKDGKLVSDETVFKWELTRQEFIQLIRDNHPEIKNSEKFFDKHEAEIIRFFEKGFDVLVSECGATYGTIMNDAIDNVIE